MAAIHEQVRARIQKGLEQNAHGSREAVDRSILSLIGNQGMLELLAREPRPTEDGRGGRELPALLKARAEQASGLELDGVRVHYNSDRPAKMEAFAVTQGDDIYLGRGAESTLSHELVHVVQQRAGQVRANVAVGGVPLNDSPALERAADLAQFPSCPSGAAEAEGAASPVVQRTVWKFVGGRWIKFSGDPSAHPAPFPNHPAEGEFFDDDTGDTIPCDSTDYMGSLTVRRHQQAKAGAYSNVSTEFARHPPTRSTPCPNPADPTGAYSKAYPLFGQTMASGSGFGVRAPLGAKKPRRTGPPAYPDFKERAPYPEGVFDAIGDYLIQRPTAPIAPVPTMTQEQAAPIAPAPAMTQEQAARISSLTTVQLIENARVDTGGSLPYAAMKAAEQYGPAAAFAEYPFAPKGGTRATRELAEGERAWTQEQARMFLPHMPSSPLLRNYREEPYQPPVPPPPAPPPAPAGADFHSTVHSMIAADPRTTASQIYERLGGRISMREIYDFLRRNYTYSRRDGWR